LDIGVVGYIGILSHKEHPPEVWHIPPGTPCVYINTPSEVQPEDGSEKPKQLLMLKNGRNKGLTSVVANVKMPALFVLTYKVFGTDKNCM
jgi:hypothetical protein